MEHDRRRGHGKQARAVAQRRSGRAELPRRRVHPLQLLHPARGSDSPEVLLCAADSAPRPPVCDLGRDQALELDEDGDDTADDHVVLHERHEQAAKAHQ